MPIGRLRGKRTPPSAFFRPRATTTAATARWRQAAVVAATESLGRHLLAFGNVASAGLPPDAVAAVRGDLDALTAHARAGFDRLTGGGDGDGGHPSGFAASGHAAELLAGGRLSREEFFTIGPALFHLGEACDALDVIAASRADGPSVIR